MNSLTVKINQIKQSLNPLSPVEKNCVDFKYGSIPTLGSLNTFHWLFWQRILEFCLENSNWKWNQNQNVFLLMYHILNLVHIFIVL